MCDFQIAHLDMDYFITMTGIRLHNTNCCILSKKLDVNLLSICHVAAAAAVASAAVASRLIIFGGKPLDFSIYIVFNKSCAASRPHKCMGGPLGPPKILCSLWLH